MAEFVDSQYFPEGYTVPDPNDALSRGFWEAAREGRLVVQQCRDCPTVQHPPEVLCHACHSFDLGWKEVSGRATIYSFTRTVHPANDLLRERGPYNVVLLQLDDHPEVRMLGNVLDADEEGALAIGMPLRVVFERTAVDPDVGEIVQPRWRLAEPESG